MAKKKNEIEKTNVMRLLDQKGITYNSYCYVETGETNGEKVAEILGQNPDRVFKTLVTRGKSNDYFVFVIPVNRELNLKKAAKAVGQKSIEMIKSKELLPLTGYIHGGCSPIGMKKLFSTTVHETAAPGRDADTGAPGRDANTGEPGSIAETGGFDTIFFSAGKVGYQVEVSPEDLASMIPIEFADLCD